MKKFIWILLIGFLIASPLYAGYAPQIKGLDNTGIFSKDADGNWNADGDVKINGALTATGSVYAENIHITGAGTDAYIQTENQEGTVYINDDCKINDTLTTTGNAINFYDLAGQGDEKGHLMYEGTDLVQLTGSGVRVLGSSTGDNMNPALKVEYSADMPTDEVGIGTYGYAVNTGTNSNTSGHVIGVLGYSVDNSGGNHNLYGIEGKTLGHSGNALYYTGLLGQGIWRDSDSGDGTTFTGTVVGGMSQNYIYNYDGSTARNEGTSIGYWIQDCVGSNANYGLYISAQTGGNVDIGALINEADTYTLWLNSDSGSSKSGIVFGSGGDARLYRSGAGTIKLYSGQAVKITTVSDADYTASTSDYIIAYTSLTAARTVTLPSGASTGQVFIIKDEAGASSSYTITIATAGSETIDGTSTKSISYNYDSMTLYFDGSNYYII